MDLIPGVGWAVIAAYLAKDSVNKLLGPVSDYYGNEIKNLAQYRANNLGKVLAKAYEKSGDSINETRRIPPRVLKEIVNEASYCDNPLAVEYLGGVLASSRTEEGRDDRGVRLAKIVDNLSIYQLRTHYLLYSTIATLFCSSGGKLGTPKDRAKLKVFLPFVDYMDSMEFTQEELDNLENSQIMDHIWHGLSSDGLIESAWHFGMQEALKKYHPTAPGNGIICSPSLVGAELFLWAFGYGNSPIENLLSGDLNVEIEGIPCGIPNAIATRNKK